MRSSVKKVMCGLKGSFNKDLIYGIRAEDKIEKYINILFSSLNEVCKDIEYLGYRYDSTIDDKFNLESAEEGKTTKHKKVVYYAKTYAQKIIFSFRLHNNNFYKDKEVAIWIPIINDSGIYYTIRGSQYLTPYQIIDSIDYTINNRLIILKTATRSFKFEKKKAEMVDVDGISYASSNYLIQITNKQIPFLLVYFAKFGVLGTIKYFLNDNTIVYNDRTIQIISLFKIEGDDDIKELKESRRDLILFRFGMFLLGMDREYFASPDSYVAKTFLSCILHVLSNQAVVYKYLKDVSILDGDESRLRWFYLLAISSITKSKIKGINELGLIDKGKQILQTFETRYDRFTKDILNAIYDEYGSKNDTFAVFRYYFIRFSIISSKRNTLQNKRIRIGEYLIHPLVTSVLPNIYKYKDANKKSKTMNLLERTLNIDPQIICNGIIGKVRDSKSAISITTYAAVANDMLLTKAFNFSKAGPGSAMNNSGKKGGGGTKDRALNADELGSLDLVITSNQNPGTTGQISPSAKFNLKTKSFVIDDRIVN